MHRYLVRHLWSDDRVLLRHPFWNVRVWARDRLVAILLPLSTVILRKYGTIGVRMNILKKCTINGFFTCEKAILRGTAPGAARTRNLRLRRPSFYPVELRARLNPEHNAI